MLNSPILRNFILAVSTVVISLNLLPETHGDVRRVEFGGYEDCIEISNASTRVVLGHHFGGRLLCYETNGQNILYLDPKEAELNQTERKSKRTTAGRFDIGPEYLMPRTQEIWSGQWNAEVTSKHSAKMTSQIDPKNGILVTREFWLDPNSSKLTVRQTVENRGTTVVRCNYWSRTFANHGGVAVIPCIANRSLLPNLYYMSHHRYLIDFRPQDESIRRVKDFLVVDGPPKYPKLGIDCAQGWVGYQTRDNLLFVKSWPVYEDKKYGDVGKINFSLWYPSQNQIPACEIEPIGPQEKLKPGEKSSFQVNWWLLPRPFPKSGKVDPEKVERFVFENCQLIENPSSD